jgi:hypothetical protein
MLGLMLGGMLWAPELTGQTPPSSPPANKPQARVRTSLEGFDLSPNAAKGPNQKPGASRGIEHISQYAPNSSQCFSTLPYFQWGPSEPNEKVTFELKSADGQIVYETTTTADHLKYPAGAPALSAGSRYSWVVSPAIAMMDSKPTVAFFAIVSGAEREQIANELKSASDAVAAARVFVKHRIWYDAVESYTEQIERTPNDEDARAGRAELYYSLQVTRTLSDADWSMIH